MNTTNEYIKYCRRCNRKQTKGEFCINCGGQLERVYQDPSDTTYHYVYKKSNQQTKRQSFYQQQSYQRSTYQQPNYQNKTSNNINNGFVLGKYTFQKTTLVLAIANLILFLFSLSNQTAYQQKMASYYYYTIREGQWYRIITAMFSHFDFFHILSNMFGLLVIGSNVEMVFRQTTSHWRYLAYYFICGIGAGFISVTLQRNAMCMGASCAIYGLLGMQFMIYKAKRSQIVENIVIMLLAAITYTNLDLIGHFAGLGIGISLGVAYRNKYILKAG